MTGTPFRLPTRRPRRASTSSASRRCWPTWNSDFVFNEWRFNLRTGQTRERVHRRHRQPEFPVINSCDAWAYKTRYSWNVLMGRQQPRRRPALLRPGALRPAARTAARPTTKARSAGGAKRRLRPRRLAEEDDGYLVGFMWNDATQQSQACVFDAHDIAQGPLCRITPAAACAAWFPRHLGQRRTAGARLVAAQGLKPAPPGAGLRAWRGRAPCPPGAAGRGHGPAGCWAGGSPRRCSA